MKNEDIARICHEANRALQIIQGDPAPSPAWDDAPEWQTSSAVEGVAHALDGMGPVEMHQSWCEFKRADGWVFGEVKDVDTKTHPCLVDYADLPADQQIKDHLFGAIVSVFR